jgi:hypothetical protein
MVNFDMAAPGTGPPMISTNPAPTVELLKYNNTFNYSLKSKSDLNLNPQPEGSVGIAGPKAEQNRSGVYVNETDRGELSPTIETNVNIKGQSQFQNRLQDEVRTTTKETTIFAYDGTVAPVTKAQALYSQFVPSYSKAPGSGGKLVRTSGAQNYSLRTATEHSYFAGPATTGSNNSVPLDPDAAYKNLYKKPDFNVDGPGTYKGARPDGSKFQNYTPIAKPTTNGLKLDFNVEKDSDVSVLQSYSPLLGKNVKGVENRYTATYQLAPLFTNPLHKVWNPDNKGEIPTYLCNSNPGDYSYMGMVNLPSSQYIPESGTNVTSPNSYLLGLESGNNNNQLLQWKLGPSNLPGVYYNPIDDQKVTIGKCYMGNGINVSRNYIPNEYTTLGDPSAGMLAN